jgi:ferric-dicitrate binding protein FerR (iron transport regulator)
MENNQEDILHKIHILKALETDIQENKSINKAEGYRKTRKKIQKISRKQSFAYFLNRAAAVLIIPLLISTSILSYILLTKRDTNGLAPVTFAEITAQPGTIIKTQLPDLSEVWLNSGSTLRYPTQFSAGKRTVELTGEAFFEVQSHPEHPFEVSTYNGIRIIAKGTSFNVNAYPEDPIAEATLQEGLIDVCYKKQDIAMVPNEIISIHKTSGRLEKSTVNIDEKIGWKDGLLIFRNTPLDEVLRKISRRYNVEIVLHRETNTDYRIRATFSSETLLQILNILKIAAPIRWAEGEMHQNPDSSYSRQQIDVWIK